MPLVPELDLKGLEPVRFVFPNAPVIPVTINGGYRMRAWYDVLGLELIRKEDEAGLRASMKLVEELIAREKARGIEVARIVLAGFSQGCAMTLLTGIRHQGTAWRTGGAVWLSATRRQTTEPPSAMR